MSERGTPDIFICKNEPIDRAEHLVLSERDSLKVLHRLENPPKPTDRLIRAGMSRQILA